MYNETITVNLKCKKADTFNEVFYVYDLDLSLFNNIKMKIYDLNDNIIITDTNINIFMNDINNFIDININKVYTNIDESVYKYEIEVTNASNERYTIISGNFTIEQSNTILT